MKQCACPGFADRFECITIRYGRDPATGDDGLREGCECLCHDDDDFCPDCDREWWDCVCRGRK